MKKLYRSREDNIICGVCGGLAEYFGISSSLVRLIVFLLIFVGGMSIWVYIAAVIFIPLEPKETVKEKEAEKIDPDEDFY